MSRSTLLLTILLIVTTALLGIEAYFALTPKTSSSTPQAIQPSTTTAVDSKRLLPISLTNPAIRSASVNYTLRGIIREVKNSTQGLQLITDIIGKEIPQFIITSKTNVFSYNEKGKRTEVTSSELKPGKIVNINIVYLPLKNSNYVSQVNILPENVRLTLTPSPKSTTTSAKITITPTKTK